MKNYFSFIGPPGSGKTTQITLLNHLLGATNIVASVPRLVRQEATLQVLLSDEERIQIQAWQNEAAIARNKGELAPIWLDALLFNVITRVPNTTIVTLDGCPRGKAQAELFLQNEVVTRATTIIQLYFPDDDEIALSLHRQYEREKLKRGRDAADNRMVVFQRKAEVYQTNTRAGLTVLGAAGIPVVRVNALESSETIHAIVRAVVEGSRDIQPVER